MDFLDSLPSDATGAIVTWSLVALRLLGIGLLLPHSSRQSPLSMRMRLAVVGLLACLVAPICPAVVPEAVETATFDWGWFARVALREVVAGAVLGLGVHLLLTSVQTAGQLISQMSGLSLATAYDQSAGGQSLTVITRLFDLMAVAIFLVAGGHRLVIDGLLSTFQMWPPGAVQWSGNALEIVSQMLTQCIVLGVQAGLPVMTILIVSNLAIGLLGRMAPQLNVMVTSNGVNILLLLSTLLVGMGAMTWTFQDQLVNFTDSIESLFLAGDQMLNQMADSAR